ncbi:uncharacterized protein LOC134257755 [Saccostrea cucullata]|uniref:uncharacterized protein LOC134257755 n=1 Tax=Saccostrea cuccullata TaxID=36930 RepID=UPI002ED50D56
MSALNTSKTAVMSNNSYDILNSTQSTRNKTVSTNSPYDAEGALKFTVAVVAVYGVAVLGVFVLGYFGRKRHGNNDLDQQASSFLVNLEKVRNKLEKERQIGNVKSLLRSYSMSMDSVTDRRPSITSSLLTESERTSDTGLVPNSSKICFGSPDTLPPLHEGLEEGEEENDDDNDSVFMTEEERQRYGVDMYMNVKETQDC